MAIIIMKNSSMDCIIRIIFAVYLMKTAVSTIGVGIGAVIGRMDIADVSILCALCNLAVVLCLNIIMEMK